MLTILIKNSATILSNRAIAIALNLVSLMLITRIVSQPNVGLLLLYTSIYLPLSVLIRAGLDQATLKMTSDFFTDGKAKKTLLNRILFNFGCVSLLVFLIYTALITLLVSPENYVIFISIYVWAWFSSLTLIVSEHLIANRLFFIGSFTKNALAPLIILSFLTFYFLDDTFITVQQILNIYMMGFFLSALTAFIFSYKKNQPSNELALGLPSKKAIFLFALPLLVTQIINFLNSQSDIWFISLTFEPEMIGIYGVAAKIVFFIGFFLTISSAALAPYVSEYKKNEQVKELELIAQKITTIALLPGLLIFVLIQLFAEPILVLLYGPPYELGANVLRILAIGQLVGAIVGPCGYILIMLGKGKIIACLSVFSITIIFTLMGVGYFYKLPLEYFAFSASLSIIIYQIGLWKACSVLCSIKTNMSVGVFLNVRRPSV